MYTAGYSGNLYAENIGVIPDIYDVCHLYHGLVALSMLFCKCAVF